MADGVDHLGHEGHGGHLAGVATGLGALGDDDVAPGLHRGHGVTDLAAHVDHQHIAAVAELDDVAGTPSPATKTVAPPSMMALTLASRS